MSSQVSGAIPGPHIGHCLPCHNVTLVTLFQQLDDSGEEEEAAEEEAQCEPDQPQREREQWQQRPEPLRSAEKNRENILVTERVQRAAGDPQQQTW